MEATRSAAAGGLVLLALLSGSGEIEGSVASREADLRAGEADTVSRTLTLMPWPERVQRSDGRLRLDRDFEVAILGDAGERVVGAANRTLERIGRRTTLFLKQGRVSPGEGARDADLRIRVSRPGELTLGEDESYRLKVDSGGVLLRAPTDLGALHGLETLLQLLDADGDGPYLPAVAVEDRPRFAWRGLMIDVARHFMPVEVLRRNVDAMARLKLNVLHLHLTDDQGFRVESQRQPRLHREASDGRFYTRPQLREIVAYAAERGIRVVPEFDVPGHATSWLVAYPEYASAPGPYELERGFGIFEPVFDPTREETYRFLGDFLGEMAEIFPDQFVHLGGDEVAGGHWRRNPEIRSYMETREMDGTEELQAHFLDRLTDVVREVGKTPVVWGGLAADLSEDVVVQEWQRGADPAEVARRGRRVLLSRGYYLDLMRPAGRHYRVDPLSSREDLRRNARERVLGGEAAMWSEHVDAGTVDSRIWPRAAAVAERLWSPGSVTDVDDMYRRLAAVTRRLDGLGVRHRDGPRSILRSLAGQVEGDRVEALRLLAGLAAPVEGLRWRGSERRYTVHSPLTRFADAAVADPARARRFETAVERFVGPDSGLAGVDPVRAELEDWLEALPVLRELVARRPQLREVAPLVERIAALARRGLEALDYSLDEGPATASWMGEAASDVRWARGRVADTRLLVVDPVVRLIGFAAEGRDGE